MADQKPAEQKPAAQPRAEAQQPKAPEPEQKAQLGSAAASSNPLVHQLLAERIIAESTGVDDKDAVKAIDKKLADLGVTVE
jgi:acetylglutamate synthase